MGKVFRAQEAEGEGEGGEDCWGVFGVEGVRFGGVGGGMRGGFGVRGGE